MSDNRVLVELFEHLNQTSQPVILNWLDIQSWSDGALPCFVANGLLVETAQAESITCRCCEEHCFVEVFVRPAVEPKISPRAFAVCDDPNHRQEVGRINIPLEQLQQWKTSSQQIAKVVAGLLELDFKPAQQSEPTNIRLGMLSSKQGRRWVSLNTQPLSIEINQRTAPLEELIYFEEDQLCIDRPRINEMLLAAPRSKEKTYTPSTSKREAGKRKTEAMYQDWRDAYLRLKRQHPDKNAKWIAAEIKELPIAQGMSATTIYRRMKG